MAQVERWKGKRFYAAVCDFPSGKRHCPPLTASPWMWQIQTRKNWTSDGNQQNADHDL